MMDKDTIFNKWNEQKKSIDKSLVKHFYREREIWWSNLGKNIGSEQDGKGDNYERPVLILKAFSRSVCLIVPLTTSTKTSPYSVKIGLVNDRESSIIISQIRLIDTKRLINRIAILEESIFKKIRKNVRDLF